MQKTIDQVMPGWDVIGSDDQRIGEVSELGDTYVLMTKGVIFGKNVYVPEQAIDRVDAAGERLYLRIGRDQVDGMGWDNPPDSGEAIPLGPGESDEARRDEGALGRGVGSDAEMTTEQHNAASTGWQGANEVIEDDFERQQIEQDELHREMQNPGRSG